MMRANANNIWEVPAYLSLLQPELTSEAVAEVERSIGFAIPREYLELLSVQNGGGIRWHLPKVCHCKLAGIGPFSNALSASTIWKESQEFVSFELADLISIDGDGHWHLCLDYRKNPHSPRITYIDVECDQQREIAPEFATYLRMLERPEVDSTDLVIPTVPHLATLKRKLAEELGTEFRKADRRSMGYPVHSASVGPRRNPEWISLSPNFVPRTFARENRPHFGELKNRMPGKACRYPELSETAWIVDCTEGVRVAVVDALQKAGIEFHPLRHYFV